MIKIKLKTKNRMTMPTIPLPKTFTVPLKNIVIPPDRGRKSFTRVMELAESISKYGVIHPIVVAKSPTYPDKYILVAGERRYRAMILAGVSQCMISLREESGAILAEIEREENVCRCDISYEEEGNILSKIQDEKKKENPSWGLVETAQMTGRSLGDVSTKIALAKKFKKRPDFKEACAGMPYIVALKKVKQLEEIEKVQRLSDQGKIQLTTDLMHGDCRDLIATLDDGSVDLMITDPPYGLERLEALRKPGSAKMTGHQLMSDKHNMTIIEVCDLLQTLAPELARVLKEGSHFYMFCGFQYIGRFIDALSPHLEFQPPLLIWDRGKPSSPGYGYNYLSRAEAIIYGHRSPRGKRLNEQKYNILECPDVPRGARIYPTEKPVPLLQTLIAQSSILNDLVLDPFAGSGSLLEAARASGRRAVGFEVDKGAYLRAQQRLTNEGDDGD